MSKFIEKKRIVHYSFRVYAPWKTQCSTSFSAFGAGPLWIKIGKCSCNNNDEKNNTQSSQKTRTEHQKISPESDTLDMVVAFLLNGQFT